MDKVIMSLLRGVCQVPAYVANEMGFFRELDLEVTLDIAATAWQIPDRLADGQSDFAILPWTRTVLENLRRAGVGRPDLVVVSDGDAADAAAVTAMVDRHGPLPVLAPPLHRVRGARTARVGQVVDLGEVLVEVTRADPSLVVEVR